MKGPITFHGYNFVAKEAMIATSDHGLACFSHLFLILSWTVMARSVSVGTVMLDHLSRENDSLLVTTPKHKGDQVGNHCYPKRVYGQALRSLRTPTSPSMSNRVSGKGEKSTLNRNHWLQSLLPLQQNCSPGR